MYRNLIIAVCISLLAFQSCNEPTVDPANTPSEPPAASAASPEKKDPKPPTNNRESFIIPNGTIVPPLKGEWLTPLEDNQQAELKVVEFWFLNCGNCRQFLPYLKKIHADYASRGVQFMGVNGIDNSKDRVQDYLTKNEVKFPQLWQAGHTVHEWSITIYPTLYILDEENKVLWCHRGGGLSLDQELRSKLEEFL